jgi:membrane protease YdiL (CAAX protease family)
VTDWIDPSFGLDGTVLLGLLVVAAIGMPLRRSATTFLERLRRAREADPNALAKHYLNGILSMWMLGGVALLVPAVDPGVTLTDIGLGPAGPGFWYAAAYILLIVLTATPIRVARQRRSGARSTRPAPVVSPMQPSTTVERCLAAALSITAGVIEEIKFRGLFIAAGMGLLHLTFLVAALVSAVVFGFGHRYQGARGMVGTGILGFIFALLYLVSGNLLLPIVLHVFIDVLALVIAPMIRARRPVPAPDPAARDILAPTVPAPAVPGAVPAIADPAPTPAVSASANRPVLRPASVAGDGLHDLRPRPDG